MKKQLISLLFFCSTSYAQFEGMTEAEMQKMMSGVQQMQACFANIDQTAIETLAAEGEQLEREIKLLCSQDKRLAAYKKAMAYYQEAKNNKSLEALRNCGEQVTNMLPALPFQDMGSKSQQKDDSSHICDGY